MKINILADKPEARNGRMEVYMGYGTESSLFGIVAAVLGIVLILTVVLRMWKKVPQDKAGVVTGMKKRVITGGGGLVIPVFERIVIFRLEIYRSVLRHEAVFQARVYQLV